MVTVTWTVGRVRHRRRYSGRDDVLARYRRLQVVYFEMAKRHVRIRAVEGEMFALRDWLNENYPEWQLRSIPLVGAPGTVDNADSPLYSAQRRGEALEPRPRSRTANPVE